MGIKVNKNFFKEMDKKTEKGLISAANFTKVKIKEALNRSGGTSNPGEPPRRQSGDLFKSIKIDKSEIKSKKVKIGSDEDYAPILEIGSINIQARPYLRPTFRKNKQGILKAFLKG